MYCNKLQRYLLNVKQIFERQFEEKVKTIIER